MTETVILDTCSLIELAKIENWKYHLINIASRYILAIPTVVIFEFNLGKIKMSENEQELSDFIRNLPSKECIDFGFELRNNSSMTGLFVVNPSATEWQAATYRLLVESNEKQLDASSRRKRQMDHLIYAIARNLFGAICTSNIHDFAAISKMANRLKYDGGIDIISLKYFGL